MFVLHFRCDVRRDHIISIARVDCTAGESFYFTIFLDFVFGLKSGYLELKIYYFLFRMENRCFFPPSPQDFQREFPALISLFLENRIYFGTDLKTI